MASVVWHKSYNLVKVPTFALGGLSHFVQDSRCPPVFRGYFLFKQTGYRKMYLQNTHYRSTILFYL